MESWAAEELKQADLGDVRRNKRLIRVVEDLAAQPTSSVPQACGNEAATAALYDLWKSPYFEPNDIRYPHQLRTVERIKEESIVLAIQDTTNIDLTHHPGTKNLGYLDNRYSSGLKVHSTLATTIKGVPLGIINQSVWAREEEDFGIAKQRRQRLTKEKESQRWLDSLNETQNLISSDKTVVTICDREGDIFDLFNLKRPENSHFLIRGTHNRKVNHESQYLHEAIAKSQVAGKLEVEVKRNPQHAARKAVLTIKFETLEIEVPSHHIAKKQLQSIKLQVILAVEENPTIPGSAIHWLLLTTLPVNDLSDAARYVKWYTYRWLIERYHYTLKSGCKIEELQLETARRIEMALATFSIVAWRLLWITYETRVNPNQPCDVILEKFEWQSLWATINKKLTPPTQPPSLREAVRMIASLGGFLGRKRDGEPGIKTIWQGFRRLHDIAATWKLLYD